MCSRRWVTLPSSTRGQRRVAAGAYDDHHATVRNNLTARLALGSLDAEGIRMLGVASSDPVAMTLDGTPGRGVCIGFGDDPRPSACQIAWLDQHEALAQVRPTSRQGLNAINPNTSESDPGEDVG
jgi:hypothetical protein